MYLAIHGGREPKGEKLDDAIADIDWICRRQEKWESRLTDPQKQWLYDTYDAKGGLTYGDFFLTGIVAIARLARVTKSSKSCWALQGQFHWELTDVLTLDVPITYRGAQGLWQIDSHTLDKLREIWAASNDGLVNF